MDETISTHQTIIYQEYIIHNFSIFTWEKTAFLENVLYYYLYLQGEHMANQAGGRRRSVVNPGTKPWRPPVEITQFWRPRSGFGARFHFCKTKQKLNY